jgi:hypothetical protein
MVHVLFLAALSTQTSAGEKEVESKAAGASVFVGLLLNPSIKAKIIGLKEVISVKRDSVSRGPNDIVSPKRLFLRLESSIEIQELRKSLSNFVEMMVTETGGSVSFSEIGFPPATFSIIAKFDDGIVKIDGAISKTEGDGFDVVIFIGQFGRGR